MDNLCRKRKRINDTIDNADGGSNNNEEIANHKSREIFEKLKNMVEFRKKEDVAWDKFTKVFQQALEANIAQEVLEQKEDFGGNLFSCLCTVKGGPPSDIVKIILEVNSNVIYEKNKYWDPCLHYCIRYNAPLDIVKYIIDISPKATTDSNDYKETPLHCIRKETSFDVVKYIVETNPKTTIMRDKYGKTPLERARMNNASEDVILYLSKYIHGYYLKEAPKPKFPEYPKPTHGGNGTVKPIFWGMTLAQFNSFIHSCEENHRIWEALRYRNLGTLKDEPFVSGYDINDYFVKEFTAKFGSCVALRINWDNPRRAQIMVSHPWGEDIKETQRSLNDSIEDKSTVIWFCIFANYQNEDGYGPSLTEQIKMEPFKQVISIPDLKGMVVVHSSKTELYDRKWCVHEIDEALDRRLNIIVGCSAEYLDAMLWGNLAFNVDTATAKCSIKSDEDYIDSLVMKKKGGYDRLNRVIREFREKFLETEEIIVTIPAGEAAGLRFDGDTKPPIVSGDMFDDSFFKDRIPYAKDTGVTVGTFVTKLTLEDGTEYTDMTGKELENHVQFGQISQSRKLTFKKPNTKVKRDNLNRDCFI